MGPLEADGGGLAVARQHLSLVREREKLPADALDDFGKAGVRIGRVARTAREQRVARKEMLTAEQADAPRRMARCVHRHDFVLAEAEALTVADAMIGLERHHRF